MRAWINERVQRDARFAGLFDAADYADLAAFYDARPALSPTALVAFPRLAASLGVGSLDVKDETSRFGLEAFKITGVHFALGRLDARDIQRGLVCATAGNHGRAVARAAHARRVPCTVFVPAPREDAGARETATRNARVAGMRADGATIVDVPGTYEAAVEAAAGHASRTGALIVSDTSWAGYDDIPHAIMTGYTRVFAEAAAQWEAPPDVVFVQGGVGGLVAAAASWFAWRWRADRPFLVACEPDSAACLLASAEAGRLTHIETGGTMMAGLRCGLPSPAAWPAIAGGADAFIAIPDELALDAIALLARNDDHSVAAGPSGACGVGAILAAVRSPQLATLRNHLGIGQSTRILAVVTEGP